MTVDHTHQITGPYLLFGGQNYYPAGGWGDFQGGYPTLDEARAAADDLWCEWFEIVHLQDCTREHTEDPS